MSEATLKKIKKLMDEVNALSRLSDLRPYGCKCPTLAIKLTGDGCDECRGEHERSNPEED